MSRDNQGNKQTIVLHKCLIKNLRYDLVITPHRQKIGYIRSKRQTQKKTVITKEKQIIRKRFSKGGNAVSESDTNTIQELQDLEDSLNRNNPDRRPNTFSRLRSHNTIINKRKTQNKKSYINKPISLYNWHQPMRHIECYTLTVLQYKT